MKRFLFACLFILISALTFATQRTVTLSTDNNNSPTVGMLRYWILNAASGDTIVFSVATVNLDTTLRMSGGKSLTIDGGENGVVLDVNNNGRVFNISCYSGDNIYLRNLTIKNGSLNSSLAMGGGMYAYISSGNLQVENCTFLNNSIISDSDGQGGALRTNGGTFTNCFFLNNSVTGPSTILGGGAIFTLDATFINCVIAGNSAAYGGGVYAATSNFYNCTITQNEATADGLGGGINCEDNCQFINSIIYNNKIGGFENNVYNYLGSSTFQNCALESGNSLVGINSNIGLSITPFLHSGNDSLSLKSGSVCEDAGTTSEYTVPETDIIGNNRASGNSIDIGAYEFQFILYPQIIVTNNSANVADEYSLPWAILHIENGGLIKFDADYHIVFSAQINISKSLSIDGTGHFIELDGNNATRIFNISGSATDIVVLKSMVIQNGYDYPYGGGIYANTNNGNYLEIVNCVFEKNKSIYGGALYFSKKGKVINSTFCFNNADYQGGACYNSDTVTFKNCLFYNNLNGNKIDICGNYKAEYCASDFILNGMNNKRLWANPFIGGIGTSRYQLNDTSFCSNAGSHDTTGLHLPAADIDGNLRVLNDTIDIGAYESNYNSTALPQLYQEIVIDTNCLDSSVENSILWAIKNADEGCEISFSKDLTFNIDVEILLGEKSLTIDGTGHKIIFDGLHTSRILNIVGCTEKKYSIKNLVFQNGKAPNGLDGGGVYANLNMAGYIKMYNCTFYNNSASNGGGIRVEPRSPADTAFIIQNSVFYKNTAGTLGGAMVINSNTTWGMDVDNRIINCTFKDNHSGYYGGSVFANGNNRFINCVFYGNTSETSTKEWIYNGSYTYNCATDGVLTTNFIKLYSTPFADDSLLLKENSPCVNAGTPDTTGLHLIDFDLGGNSRVINDTIDIGAYESNFANKVKFKLYDHIIVTDNSFDAEVENSFLWAIQHIKDKGLITFASDMIIPFSYHIVLGDKSLTIDGENHKVVFDGGNNNRIFRFEGLPFKGIQITLKNLVFQNGQEYQGGALVADVYNGAQINLENCTFYKNSATNGGAIYNESKFRILNCVFIENVSSSNGGSIYFSSSVSKISNCIFYNNSASHSGGGIYSKNGVIDNSVFYGNISTSGKDVYNSTGTKLNYSAATSDFSSLGTGNIILSENPFKGGSLSDSLYFNAGSVLINAGNPDTTGFNLPAYDYAGKTRIVGDTIDIGAYEFYNYTINTSVNNSNYGEILPGTIQVMENSSHQFDIFPKQGVQIDSVLVDEVLVDSLNTYTFIDITSDRNLRAVFVPDTFQISAVCGSNGELSYSATKAIVFDTVNFSIKPDTGYSVASALLNGTEIAGELVDANSVFTYSITGILSNQHLDVSFQQDTFTITTNSNYTGNIVSANKNMVTYQDTILFTITPNNGYSIQSATFGGVDVLNELADYGSYYSYSAHHILSDKNFAVQFKLDTFRVISIPELNGHVEPDTAYLTFYSYYTFSIYPDTGYKIATATFGGNDILGNIFWSNDRYVYNGYGLTADKNLDVTYAVDSFNINISSNGGGTFESDLAKISYFDSCTVTFKPDPGYYVYRLFLNGNNIINELLPAGDSSVYILKKALSNANFYIDFEPDTFTVTSSCNSLGTIEPQTLDITYFNPSYFTILPATGCKVISATYNGTNVLRLLSTDGESYYYTPMNQLSDGVFEVEFAYDTFYITTGIMYGQGTISPADTDITYIETIDFVITPGEGYLLDSATFNGIDIRERVVDNDNYFTFLVDSILANKLLKVGFAKEKLAVSADIIGNGTVSPVDTVVNYSTPVIITIKPDIHFKIHAVMVNNKDVISQLVDHGDYFTLTVSKARSDIDIVVEFVQYESSLLDANFLSDVNIFPNPATDFIQIELGKEKINKTQSIKLYSVSGELVLFSVLKNSNSIVLNLSGIDSGEYMLSIIDNEGKIIEQQKVIINR